MHAQNLFWFALMILAATRLYRGVMGPTIGGLAALLYVLDHTTHGFPRRVHLQPTCAHHGHVRLSRARSVLPRRRGNDAERPLARPASLRLRAPVGRGGHFRFRSTSSSYALFVLSGTVSARIRSCGGALPSGHAGLQRTVYTAMGYGARRVRLVYRPRSRTRALLSGAPRTRDRCCSSANCSCRRRTFTCSRAHPLPRPCSPTR